MMVNKLIVEELVKKEIVKITEIKNEDHNSYIKVIYKDGKTETLDLIDLAYQCGDLAMKKDINVAQTINMMLAKNDFNPLLIFKMVEPLYLNED